MKCKKDLKCTALPKLESKTGKRIIPKDFKSKEEFLICLKHLFAYEFAKGKISKNDLVLEVGCGEGYGTKLLSKKSAKIIGLDVDKDIIMRASEKYGSKKCYFKLYDGIKIPYKDNIFDAVVSFQVIEHVQDDVNYISEVHRVLKKSGILILTTPNKNYRLKPGQKLWNEFHLREYHPHELRNVLKTKFSGVNVWGIRANDKMQQIEYERVLFFGPLNLRKLRLIFIKYLKEISPKKQNFFDKYNIKDYYITKEVKNSLDLLGICKK